MATFKPVGACRVCGSRIWRPVGPGVQMAHYRFQPHVCAVCGTEWDGLYAWQDV